MGKQINNRRHRRNGHARRRRENGRENEMWLMAQELVSRCLTTLTANGIFSQEPTEAVAPTASFHDNSIHVGPIILADQKQPLVSEKTEKAAEDLAHNLYATIRQFEKKLQEKENRIRELEKELTFFVAAPDMSWSETG